MLTIDTGVPGTPADLCPCQELVVLVITYYINGETGVSHEVVPEKQAWFFGKSRTLIWGDAVTR